MSVDELCALPVSEIADTDCALFFMGNLSPAARRSARHSRMGIQLQNGSFFMAQDVSAFRFGNLRAGLLDAKLRRGLSVRNERPSETKIRKHTSTHCFAAGRT